MSAAVLHSLPLQIFTLANLPCPQPTEDDPYQWTDVPTEFGMARGIGGGTPFTMNAKDAGFEITCKGTDAAHAFMFARRAAQLDHFQALRLPEDRQQLARRPSNLRGTGQGKEGGEAGKEFHQRAEFAM